MDEDQELETAEIIELFQRKKPEQFCSFCNKKESQVKKLFTNSLQGNARRNICNFCVVLATEKTEKEVE